MSKYDHPQQLILALTHFEGPMELLLDLAKRQKLDLREINIVALVDQYVAFIRQFEQRNLEIAADYLVMAAWLTYLKSRLLLPQLPSEEEVSGFELAENLTFHLARLEAMQNAAKILAQNLARSQLTWPRGIKQITGDADLPEGSTIDHNFAAPAQIVTVWQANIHDLLAVYGQLNALQTPPSLRIEETSLMSIEQALTRLRGLVGGAEDWQEFYDFLPDDLRAALIYALENPQFNDFTTHEFAPNAAQRRETLRLSAAYAANLVALLELGKEGQIDIRQNKAFDPIYVRRRVSETYESETAS